MYKSKKNFYIKNFGQLLQNSNYIIVLYTGNLNEKEVAELRLELLKHDFFIKKIKNSLLKKVSEVTLNVTNAEVNTFINGLKGSISLIFSKSNSLENLPPFLLKNESKLVLLGTLLVKPTLTVLDRSRTRQLHSRLSSKGSFIYNDLIESTRPDMFLVKLLNYHTYHLYHKLSSVCR